MPMTIDETIGKLLELRDLFDLSKDAQAAQLHGIAVGSIARAMDAETDPDGAGWPHLSPEYERWKARHYPGARIGEREGLMKAPEQLAGEPVRITPRRATFRYGVSDAAREEAGYFSEDRPFYGFTAEAVDLIADFIVQRWKAALR